MKPCNSCGKCCIKYGNGQLSASEDDIRIWDSLRPEISAYVRNGNIWHDPHTGASLSSCPWLRTVEGVDAYHCAIYFDRPEDCRVYPSTVNDMLKDGCEMLDEGDKKDLKLAHVNLSKFVTSDY